MDSIAGSPFVELIFDKRGMLKSGSMGEIAQALQAAGAENLVVLSHGWKFENEQPRQFYNALWGKAADALEGIERAKIVVAGVVWPSKFFTTGIDAETLRQAAAGGAQSVEERSADGDLEAAAMESQVEQAIDALDLDDADAQALRESLKAYVEGPTPAKATAFLETVAVGTRLSNPEPELADEASRLQDALGEAGTTLTSLHQAPMLTDDSASTLGLGDIVSGVLNGPRAAVVRVLEQFSYFEMKRRAGLVGGKLGGQLTSLNPAQKTRLHLVGHSFGARLVTAAANAFQPSPKLELFSLTLLQGAFSHSALSKVRGGGFAGVVGRTTGPIAISHTHNDRACTILYALASRVGGHTVNALGDKNDAFGSMGANGAQFSGGDAPAVIGRTAQPFKPARKTVNNFLADSYIKDKNDAHNDVKNATVGQLVAAVIEA